jgi:hypothetical protein
MKTWIMISALAAFAALAPGQQTKKAGGWNPLFDGKSLAGWHPEGSAKWVVAKGVVTGEGDDGWLRTEKTYTDFALRLDYRNRPKGNSGVFLRAPKESRPGEVCNPASGYELQIYNEDPKFQTGSIDGVLQRLAAVNPAPNQWHTYQVEFRGDHITVTLDGKKVLDGHDAQFKSGYVGLQHHKDNKIEFRNIAIKPL